jgi:hypothetical protein
MKGVTANQPPDSHQTATQDTVLVYRLVGVRRTAGIIPANRGEMGRHRLLIKANKCQSYLLHFNKPALLKRDSICLILPERAIFVSG